MTTKTTPPKSPVNKLGSHMDIRDLDRLAMRIAEGVDVNALIGGPRSGLAPIELAARDGNVEACRMLLAAGAKPEWCGKHQKSAMVGAISQKGANEERVAAICAMLVEAGANPNGIPKQNEEDLSISESTMYLSSLQGQHRVVKRLVSLGADLDKGVKDISWDGPREVEPILYWLRHEKNIFNETTRQAQEMMVTFLQLGANDACLALSRSGMTAFQVEVINGHDLVVEYYVRERGEDLAQRMNGQSLLQIAKKESTKALLRSLKTELAVHDAVSVQVENVKPVVAVKKSMGIMPL